MFMFRMLKKHRRFMLGIIDAFSIFVAYFLGVFVVNQTIQIHVGFSEVLSHNLFFTLLAVACMWAFGVYRNVWRYARIRDFAGCILGNVFSTAMCLLVYKWIGVEASELRMLVACLLSICSVTVLRIAYLYVCNEYIRYKARFASGRKAL